VHVLVALYLHLSQATPRSLIEAPTPHCLRCPVEPCTLRYQRRYGAPQIREVLLYQEKGCRTCGSAICSIKSETSLKARELDHACPDSTIITAPPAPTSFISRHLAPSRAH
jgi:hypothetical protein